MRVKSTGCHAVPGTEVIVESRSCAAVALRRPGAPMITRMTTRTAGRTARLAITGAALVLGATVLVVYGIWAGYLALFATEGAVPPQSRVPELPVGTEITSSDTECGSGGCWREVTISPAPHSSPDALAEELGLQSVEQRYPWSLRDPHSVLAWADADGDHLVVSLRYWGAEYTP